MISFVVSFFIFFKIVANHQITVPSSADDLHLANDKILGVIDDVFITLRISENFQRYKTVPEYMSIHNYIQDAVENRNKKYKELYNLTKVAPCDKATYYVSVINKAIGEMIREYKATTDLYFTKEYTELVSIPSDDALNDFVNMAKQLRLNLNLSNSITPVKDTEIARRPETRRIYRGVETNIRKWPFIVSVQIGGKFACAGSLIREDLIVSAATCFKRFYKKKLKKKFKNNIWIRAGSHYYNKGGVQSRAIMLHFHPKFDVQNRSNNLVVVQLKLKLILKHRQIQPIKYARKSTNYKAVNIIGWGNRHYEEESVQESPEFIRVSELPEYEDKKKKKKDNRRNFGEHESDGMHFEDRRLLHSVLEGYRIHDCKDVYPNSTITGKNFCAGARGGGSGACKYDVGGPGVVMARLEGVVSFGPSRCGASNSPTVFTKISRYARWIDKLFCKIPLTNETVDDPDQRGGLEQIGADGRKIRKYPYVAAVFVKKKFVCTGAILRRELVITVASCLEPFDFLNEGTLTRRKFTFNTNVEVGVGSDVYTSGLMIPVVGFHYHRYFKRETANFNLVILVLKHKLEFAQGEVGGIRVSRHRVLKSKYKKLHVVGWGTHCPVPRDGPRRVPPVLLRAEVLDKIWFRECRNNFSRTSFNLSRLHSCLDTNRWGDDSPGNLAILKNKLYGLLSLDCTRRSEASPSVFIKVGVFSWWINRIMCQYKERLDPSDLSKVSDYGSIENTTSEENILINGPKIRCREPTSKYRNINCTSINATTYYCERPGGGFLEHGTPIKCSDLDRWHGVYCMPGNETEMNRDDISRSVINWPHGSTHFGALYRCVSYSKNTTNLNCTGSGWWSGCDEYNCTYAERDGIYHCTHKNCYQAWYGAIICTLKSRYCKDLRLRIIECPTSTHTCWKNYTHNIAYCEYNNCSQRWLDGDPDRLITECHRQFTCYTFPAYLSMRCREAYVRDCTRLDKNPDRYDYAFICQVRKCLLNVKRNQLICSRPGPIHCVDRYSYSTSCPGYVVSNCSKIDNYIYKDAYVCWYKWCTVTRIIGFNHNCTEPYAACHANSRGSRVKILCPNIRTCRTVTVYGYDPYTTTTVAPAVLTEQPEILPDLPGEITVDLTDDSDEFITTVTEKVTTAAPYHISYCARLSVCYYLDDTLVNCKIAKTYCINATIDNDSSYEDDLTIPCPEYVINERARIDDGNDGYYADDEGNNPDKDKDPQLTTYASPGKNQNDVPALRTRTNDDDDDLGNDYDSLLTTYASPRQIPTDVPALRARTHDDDDDDHDPDNYDSQLTTYASPRQIQTDVPALRARTHDDDDDDHDPDNYDSQLTTYASPRQIQTGVPALRARTDDDDDDDHDPDNDDSQLTTYASPRQIQTDVPALRARTDDDDNDDHDPDNDDSQLTTYASPRQIQTDVPALRARTDDDDDDGAPGNDDYSKLTTNASPGQIRTDGNDDDDETLLDVYKENDAMDYSFEIRNENSS